MEGNAEGGRCERNEVSRGSEGDAVLFVREAMRLRGKHAMGQICHTGGVISLPVLAIGTLFATDVCPLSTERTSRLADRVTEGAGEGTPMYERLQAAHTYLAPPALC